MEQGRNKDRFNLQPANVAFTLLLHGTREEHVGLKHRTSAYLQSKYRQKYSTSFNLIVGWLN